MSEKAPSSAAVGWIGFAGFMLILAGSFTILAGLSLLINSDTWQNVTDTVFEQSSTTWGWWKILIGTVLLLSGLLVFSGNVLARTVGVIAAVVNAVGVFVWISFYPVWGVCIIAIDVAVIWALTAHGRDIQRARDMQMGSGAGT